MTKAVVLIGGVIMLVFLQVYYDREVKDDDYWGLRFPIDFVGNVSAYQVPQACLDVERDAIKPRSWQPHSNLTCIKLTLTLIGKSFIQSYRPTFCGVINAWATPSPDLQRTTEIVWQGLLQMSLPLYLEIIQFSFDAVFGESRHNDVYNMFRRLNTSDRGDELLQDVALKRSAHACFRKGYMDLLSFNAMSTDTKQAAVSQRPNSQYVSHL